MTAPTLTLAPYVEVAVDAPGALQGVYTYAAPPGLDLREGQAVWAPFGARIVQGVVLARTHSAGPVPPRPIVGPVAGPPALTPVQVRLARWIAEYYRCGPFEAAALMMPPGFEQHLVTYLTPAPVRFGQSLRELTPGQRRVLGAVHRAGRVDMERLRRQLGDAHVSEEAAALERLGLLRRETALSRPRAAPRMERRLRLTDAPEQVDEGSKGSAAVKGDRAGVKPAPTARLGERQRALLEALAAAGGSLSATELRAGSFAAATIGGLTQRGLARWDTERISRDPQAGYAPSQAPPPTLTPDQAAVWAELRPALAPRAPAPEGGGRPTVFLLHGVTGSGKTEVYLRALSEVIAQGRRGLLLVPEIALTPQTVQRASARFPGRVALLHSALTPGEQFDEWQRIHDGGCDVAVGSRSAIFAPQPDLGLIILDEEHESSYKQQDPAPRYHARDVALKLAGLTGAVVILGSATPDLGSYARALAGRYRLLELRQRAPAGGAGPLPQPSPQSGGDGANTPPPGSPSPKVGRGTAVPQEQQGEGHVPSLAAVTVADLRRELKEGNHTIFSRALDAAMNETLDAGSQAILFLNRRGAATFVQCRDCGNVVTCRHCDVALTYHLAGDLLLCHQCNAVARVPKMCAPCGSARIKFLGLGTQRVEEEVRRRWPDARVLRWDRDSVRTRQQHEEVLRLFQEQQADILIGTQMVAKGLDLPRVTLVGVVNADVNLFLPDFRAAERTFQLLTQVAGRAGRGPWAGRVIIQTYSPDHYAVVAAARQDYAAFFARERVFRRQHGYPPYGRMVRLLFSHPGEARARTEAESLGARLHEAVRIAGLANVAVMGPTPAYPARARGRYRWQIILLGANPHALLDRAAPPRGWQVDVDPMGM